MNIFTKHLTLAVSIVACVYTSAFALQYKDLTIDANSPETQPWFVWNANQKRLLIGVGPIKPTYVVRLHVVEKPTVLPGITSVLSTPAGMDLSQEQRDLISTGEGIEYPLGHLENFEPRVPNCFPVFLYAVSKKEAYKVTEAYIETLEAKATAPLQEARRRLEECGRNSALLRTKIEETRLSIQNIVANHGVVTSPEDINRLISSTEELKNSLSIDVAGLEARIVEITKFISAKETAPEVKTRLQQMLIDHNIELAGVLAKLKATDAARQQAEEKYMLSLRLGELRKESDELRAQLMKAEEQSREVENAYMQAQREVIHPQIFQNKATIYPVKTGD